jgi:hypothetical protein
MRPIFHLSKHGGRYFQYPNKQMLNQIKSLIRTRNVTHAFKALKSVVSPYLKPCHFCKLVDGEAVKEVLRGCPHIGWQ